MSGSATGVQWDVCAAVLSSLLLFGAAFNAFVTWAQRHGYDEGVTAFEVVVGVLITLGGASLILWNRPFDAVSLLILLLCFVASGSPMIVGAWSRYALLRRRGQEGLRDRS